jgi:hypothetical protein
MVEAKRFIPSGQSSNSSHPILLDIQWKFVRSLRSLEDTTHEETHA